MNWKNHNFWPKSCFISEMIQNRVVIIMEHQQELQARSQGGAMGAYAPPPHQTKMVRVVEYLIITVSPQERLSPPFPVYHLTPYHHKSDYHHHFQSTTWHRITTERLSPPFPVYHLTLKYCLTERPATDCLQFETQSKSNQSKSIYCVKYSN